MKRKIDAYLDQWIKQSKALMVVGARQVGKTYAVRELFKRNHLNFCEINFANDADALSLFSKLSDLDDFYMKLSLVGKKRGNKVTYLFLDEIQMVYLRREQLKLSDPDLYERTVDPITLSKAIVEDGRYRIVFSGSLLGVCLNGIRLNPIGYLDSIRMYPLDFEEYLWAKGIGNEVIDYLKKCYLNQTFVEDTIHEKIMNVFREYVLVGGMPEAVSSFIKNLDFKAVDRIQKNIIQGYGEDVSKYAKQEDKLILREAYEALPSELNRKDKHFRKSNLKNVPNTKNIDMENSFLWLTSAGIALSVFNVTDVTYPLKINEQREILKLFANDIGLLSCSLLGVEGRIKMLNHEKEINYGAPYENVIAQELSAHGFASLYYYNSKKNGEIDFVLEKETEIIPLEVKSGKSSINGYYNHSALNRVLELHPDIKEAIVLSENNISKENDRIVCLPLYMIMFLNKE